MAADPQRPKRPLPPLVAGQCMAVVDDYEHPHWFATHQRITIPNDKRCSRKHKEAIGGLVGPTLLLCGIHVRLWREGMMDGERVKDRNTIRDLRLMAARDRALRPHAK